MEEYSGQDSKLENRLLIFLVLLRLSGVLLLRVAERQFLGLLFQEPPRLPINPARSLALNVLPEALYCEILKRQRFRRWMKHGAIKDVATQVVSIAMQQVGFPAL